MNNAIIYFIGLLAVITTSSLMMEVTSREDANATSRINDLNEIINNTILINDSLNNTITNETNSSNTRLSPSDVVINATNKTAFTIGNGLADDESTRKIGGSIKPRAYPSKMWYVVQGVPHGCV
jgi:hypothetical protein